MEHRPADSVNVVAFSVVNGLLFKGFNASAHRDIGRIAITYVIVGVIEGAVVMAACLGPALRASRVDPLVALRAE